MRLSISVHVASSAVAGRVYETIQKQTSSHRSIRIATHSTLQQYLREALAQAVYQNLPDGRVVATVPPCAGVIAFGVDHQSAQQELCSVLDDWTRLGVRLRHPLPVLGGLTSTQRTLARLPRISSGIFRRRASSLEVCPFFSADTATENPTDLLE